MIKINSKLLLIIVLGIVLGLAIYGYFRAMPSGKNLTGEQPQIEITPKFFDFGEVKYGKAVEYSFKVKNLGTEILEIKRVATSCACTTAKIAKEIIEPGEEAALKVVYNTGLMSGSHAKGKQERIIYLKSNDPENPQAEVKIQAVVK